MGFFSTRRIRMDYEEIANLDNLILGELDRTANEFKVAVGEDAVVLNDKYLMLKRLSGKFQAARESLMTSWSW